MTILPCRPFDKGLSRHGLVIGVMLASAFVFARDEQRLEMPPDAGDWFSDEIYEQAEGWRTPSMTEEPWRVPEPEPRARIHFGYDSAFEEKQKRDYGFQDTRRSTFRDTTPNTQFRIEFFPKKRRP